MFDRFFLILFACLLPVAARADDEIWSLHGQATATEQYHPAFTSPYQGTNSLDAKSLGDETFDATLFAGARLWTGGEAYINPEIDQGFGLSDTVGVAGFPSGAAYKVGKASPYFRLQRLFFRQSFDLGGDVSDVASAANQLGGKQSADNLVITAGKFSVTDIFDANQYAHDPKNDFMNWAVIDTGSFDYAADAWGYSYGGTVEWTKSWWTLRAGLFDLSRLPNATALTRGFGQYEALLEGEERHTLFGHDGKLKILAFANRGQMGGYLNAIRAAAGGIPDAALVRRPNTRAGLSLNLEQGLSDDLGFFARAGLNDGSQEAYEFTEINKTISAGLSLAGTSWGRKDDHLGGALVVNGLSKDARAYFAAGGIGILIGDGRLPHYQAETILETYYSFAVNDVLALSADYQFIANPAYNPDRGPVHVLGVRLHAGL